MSKLSEIQQILGVEPDGIFGSKSRAALDNLILEEAGKKSEGAEGVPASSQFDERTERNIATLIPAAQAAARRFMTVAVPAMKRHGAEVRIICGTRTYSDQEALYAQGRTTKGPVVTKARGGYSWHNFGVAWDCGIFQNGKYLEDSPLYAECGRIGEAQGLEWGGSWGFSDEPHLQLRTGLTLAQMRERHESGQAIA